MTVTLAADVPAVVTFGEITGYFVQFIADTADVGNTPGEIPLTGSVTLTPTTTIVRYPTTTPPRTAIVARIVCPVVAGVLTAPEGGRVFVIATNQPAGLPSTVPWVAEFSFTGVTRQPSSVAFNVPTNGVVDLTTVIPAAPEPPTIVVVSTDTAVAAAASAAEAAQHATDAQSDAQNANTAAGDAFYSANRAESEATNSAGSAAAASTSQGAAAGSATTAGTHATDAGTHASDAATSATNASGSASAAAGSASAAAGSATTANNAATTAGTAATNAGNSANAAAASAADAATFAAQVIAPVAISQDWTGAVALTTAQTRATYLVRRLTGNATVTLAAGDPAKAYTCTLDLTQDATGGRTLTVLGALTSYAIPYTPTPGPGARDLVHLLWNGTGWTLLPGAIGLALPAGS